MADSVVRAMTDDGGFRVIAARTTETAHDVVRSQGAMGANARLLADLVTGTILMRETMAPGLRVQGIIRGADGGTVVADSRPEGTARGLVRVSEPTATIPLRGALLQMMRSLPNGDLHRGVVEIPEAGGVSHALMAYMQSSEQVVSMISVGCRLDGADVTAAAGYVVQLLPELAEGPLMVMTERLADLQSIEGLLDGAAATPDALIAELLYRMPYTRLEESSLRYACECSHVRVIASLATLPASDIRELMSDGKPIELSCDYCRTAYVVGPEDLRGLLEAT